MMDCGRVHHLKSCSRKAGQPFRILKQFWKGVSIKMEQEVVFSERNEVLLSFKSVKMRIAICDKDESLQKMIKNSIYHYAAKHRLDIVVDCYKSGEELLSSKLRYALIFLGYILVGDNGLLTAKKIRENNNFSSIIFVSQNTDFVFQAFSVNPFRFLVPPIREQEFEAVLDDFFCKFGNDYPIWIKNREETVCLNTGEIYYLEANNKHSVVHTKKYAFDCNKTMARVYEVLPKAYFVKINRAYIVNLNLVFSYNSDEVQLKNGIKLHISRRFLKAFKEEYRQFQNPLEP